MATMAGEAASKARAPLTPELVQRAKTMDEIDQARVDAYDEAISQVADVMSQLERDRNQIKASAAARAKWVEKCPKVEQSQSAAWVPARTTDRDLIWQHRCGKIVVDRHEPTSQDACVRCDEAPVLPGDWRQLYVRDPGSADD